MSEGPAELRQAEEELRRRRDELEKLVRERTAALEASEARYRQLLYVSGEAQGIRENGQPARRGFSGEAVEEVVAAKGRLPVNGSMADGKNNFMKLFKVYLDAWFAR